MNPWRRDLTDSPEEMLVLDLMNVIQLVDPDSWNQDRQSVGLGGPVAHCYYWAGRLVIRQTPENHDQIARLLDALRDGAR